MIRMFIPGQWKCEKRAQYPHEFYEISAHNWYVASCTDEGNANLIVHAPELFDLLSEIIDDENSKINTELRDKTQELLREITGGEDKS